MLGHHIDDDAAVAVRSVPCDDKFSQHDVLIEEEVWEAAPGMGVALQSQHQIHTIDCGSDKSFRYMSIPDNEMTPLDMIYDGKLKYTAGANTTTATDKDDDDENDDDFYDGTGNLMWTAALCFAHLVAQDVESLRKYIHRHPSESPTSTTLPAIGELSQHRTCELGCGTGGAGIALLLFSSSASSSSSSSSLSNIRHHVVFTDNDAESLDLCKRNCELNELNPSCYSHHLLPWGRQGEGKDDGIAGSCKLEKHSFDTVLATDVVYDLKMIPPLFQSVDYLLKKDGYLILSHVPRFCLPKKEEGDQSLDMTPGVHQTDIEKDNEVTEPNISGIDCRPRPYMELERHIQDEAFRIGLTVVETIRPESVLKAVPQSFHDDGTRDKKSPIMGRGKQHVVVDDFKEAHAVVFVFGRRAEANQ